MRTRTKARGYTAIEVLIAMTVMTIGAAAVMSMQKASMQGDLDARRMDVANSIARLWVERLERDAMKWTLPSAAYPAAASNLTNAKLIANHADQGWVLPNDYIGQMGNGVPETMSYGFDILGRDLAQTDLASAVFCTSIRITTLVANQLYRADVRVLWRTGLGSASGSSGGSLCSSADMVAADPNSSGGDATPTYRGIYLTTSLRENAAQ